MDVSVYILTPTQDGGITRKLIQNVPLEFHIQASTVPISPSPSPTLVVTQTEPTIGIVYYAPDIFSIIVYQPLDLSTLAFTSRKSQGTLITDFDLTSSIVQSLNADICLHYIRYLSEPPLPTQCHNRQNFQTIVGDSDVFWYQMAENQLLPIIIYYQDTVVPQVCPADREICNVYLQPLASELNALN